MDFSRYRGRQTALVDAVGTVTAVLLGQALELRAPWRRRSSPACLSLCKWSTSAEHSLNHTLSSLPSQNIVIKDVKELGMVALTCNPGPWEAEAKGSLQL